MHACLEKPYNFGFSRGGPRCPFPDRGFGTLGPSENDPNSKAPLRGAGILFSRGRAKKSSPVREKNEFEPGFEPRIGLIWQHFRPIFFSSAHRLVKLRPKIKDMFCISYGLRTAAKRVDETPSFSAAEIAVFESGRVNGRWHQSSVENRF